MTIFFSLAHTEDGIFLPFWRRVNGRVGAAEENSGPGAFLRRVVRMRGWMSSIERW